MATRELQVVQSGERTNPAGKAVSNKILLSIPEEEYGSLRPYLEFIDLPNHYNLYEPGQTLMITHDFLATMLGTDRPSVTVAAGTLQKRSLIAYTRGAVKIVNRKKLESFVCECYGIIQQFNGELGLR